MTLYEPDWRPMDTAPKDGTIVHLQCPFGDDIGYFDDEWTTEFGNGEPTGWLPFMGGLARYLG
jgi:hypothetical protein